MMQNCSKAETIESATIRELDSQEFDEVSGNGLIGAGLGAAAGVGVGMYLTRGMDRTSRAIVSGAFGFIGGVGGFFLPI